MNTRLPNHVMDEGKIVHYFAQGLHDLAHELSAVSVAFEFKGRFHPRTEPVLEGLDVFPEIRFLAMAFDQLRLMIEHVDVAGRPCHEQLDDAFGTGGMMKIRRGDNRTLQGFAGEHGCQSQAPDAPLLEKISSGCRCVHVNRRRKIQKDCIAPGKGFSIHACHRRKQVISVRPHSESDPSPACAPSGPAKEGPRLPSPIGRQSAGPWRG